MRAFGNFWKKEEDYQKQWNNGVMGVWKDGLGTEKMYPIVPLFQYSKILRGMN